MGASRPPDQSGSLSATRTRPICTCARPGGGGGQVVSAVNQPVSWGTTHMVFFAMRPGCGLNSACLSQAAWRVVCAVLGPTSGNQLRHVGNHWHYQA